MEEHIFLVKIKSNGFKLLIKAKTKIKAAGKANKFFYDSFNEQEEITTITDIDELFGDDGITTIR